ncbi:MAG: hypothetical protein CML02_15895 [Pseudooceanicola sp.]|jgi:TRAP transporter 4TM/12TM fusion protein|nr:hypothetical protein [Pseudooceanicola sp.]
MTPTAARPGPERLGKIVEALCASAITALLVYTTAFGRFSSDLMNAMFLTLTLIAVLAGRGWPDRARGALIFWGDVVVRLVMIGFAIGSGVYYMLNYGEIAAMRAGLPNTADLICYAVGIIAVIDAARRAEGLLFLGVILIFTAYLFFGHLIPGLLNHRPLWTEEILELVYSPQGIYGVAFTSVINVVWIFILLGVALRITGAGEFFNFIALHLTRGLRSGPAQCAVIASALFGSINGSAPANVASTGVLTIPMMRRAGFSAPFAAAVEATASCVGQLLPPVMGVGAFIMAEVTGIPYTTIMLVAIAPALMFIGSLSVAVALQARKLDLTLGTGAGAEATGWTPERMAQGVTLFATFAMLLALLFSGFSATYAGFFATLTTMGVATLFPQLRPGLTAWKDLVVSGGREGLALAAICAAIGIVLAGVTATGMGVKLNQSIISLGGDTLFLALLLAAACAIVIGMGLPTAAAYLTVVFIAGPALTELGIDKLQAHMFIFYYAVLSAITPPVALALFAAAAIAQCSPLVAAAQMMRLAFVGFILPIAWIYHPELMFEGGVQPAIGAIAVFCVAIVATTAALSGHGLTRLTLPERALLLAGSVGIVWPDMAATVTGCIIILLALGWQLLTRHRQKQNSEALS